MYLSGHQALRKGRCSATDRIYFITFITHRRIPLFLDFIPAAAACRTFARSAETANAGFISWVLMPDHFHGLIRLAENSNLSRIVQRIKDRSAAACRLAIAHREAVWARAFHDHALRADEDVAASARYLIENPVRSGLVDDVMRYPYWDADWLKD